MENFRAKQYENFNFEGGVGPFQTDDEIELLGEIKELENEIEYLKKDRDRYFKLWIRMGIAWVITMTSLFIVAFTK